MWLISKALMDSMDSMNSHLHPADADWIAFRTLLHTSHPCLEHELIQQSTELGQTTKSHQSLLVLLSGLLEACYSLPFRNDNEAFWQAWENTSHAVKKWIAMATLSGIWHAEWPNVQRTGNGIAARTGRIKVLGNGQVPKVAATAWNALRSLHPADAAAIEHTAPV